MNTVRGNYTKETLNRAISHIKGVVTGKEKDQFGVGLRFWSAVAHSLFSDIFQAFLTKSTHSTDELGQSWKDLSPEYKAYGRPDARRGLQLYDNRAVNTPSLRVRPTLSPDANRAWGGRWLGILLGIDALESDSSKHIAGGSTWKYFKAKGYPTLKGLTRSMKLPILNKTGTLQRSLFPSPLSGGIYIPLDANQIFRPGSGTLTIGTKRPHIDAIDRDRPLWPKSIGPWLSKAVGKGRDVLYQELPLVLEQLK